MSEETRAGEGGAAAGPGGPGLHPGTVFAGHRIESELGRGGMGVVYKATHLALDAPRALKVIAPGLSADSVFRQRFSRESRLAASIDHPNVVTVHHAGEEAGLLYLSMRLVSGRDLREIVESEGALLPSRAAAVITAVAAGLDAAHAKGLVHRDVKPANVLIETTDAGERVFLTDFGISRVSGGGSTVTSTGEILGSVDYVAPEQIEGDEVGPAADIYSLGCVAMYALTAEPPFVREGDMARLYAHANAPRPRPSERRAGLPSSVDEAVMRAMAIRPVDRFASASAMAGDLSRPLKRLGPDDVETRRLSKPGERKRRIWPALAGLAVVIAIAALVALFAFGGDDVSKDDANPAEAGKVIKTIPVSGRPNGIAVALVAWVAANDRITSIDLHTNKVDRKIGLDGRPDAVAIDYGGVWVADRERGLVLRLQPRKNAPPIPIKTGASPSDVIAAYGSIWICNAGDNTVSRIDPETNKVIATIPVGSNPRSLAAGAKGIWVTNNGSHSISRIEAGGNTIESNALPVGDSPNDLDFGAGKVWVSDILNGDVYEIAYTPSDSPSTPPTMKVIGDPIPVGPRPRGIVYGFGSAWVASGADDTVTRIDGETGKPYATPINVGDEPAGIAIGNGSVWTADSGAGGEGEGASVTRIDPEAGD